MISEVEEENALNMTGSCEILLVRIMITRNGVLVFSGWVIGPHEYRPLFE